MNIHADFTKRAMAHAEKLEWQSSPSAGVDRRLLDRIGDEVARATTIVRYAAGSNFPEHTHVGGEEFIVLEGVFQDEHGAYPVGTYVRNPPTSFHSPKTDEGCTILVKLHQFHPDERTFVRTSMDQIGGLPDPMRKGVSVSSLYHNDRETVQVEVMEAGVTFDMGHAGGYEIFILEGEAVIDGESFDQNSWLRLPAGEMAKFSAGSKNVKAWVKMNHLREDVLLNSTYSIDKVGQ